MLKINHILFACQTKFTQPGKNTLHILYTTMSQLLSNNKQPLNVIFLLLFTTHTHRYFLTFLSKNVVRESKKIVFLSIIVRQIVPNLCTNRRRVSCKGEIHWYNVVENNIGLVQVDKIRTVRNIDFIYQSGSCI